MLPGAKAAHHAPASGCPPRCAVIVNCVFGGGAGAATCGALSVEWNGSIANTRTPTSLPLLGQTCTQVSTPSLVIVAKISWSLPRSVLVIRNPAAGSASA